MPSGWIGHDDGKFQMKMISKTNPSVQYRRTVTNPETGVVAETYYRAMLYIKMWNKSSSDYHFELVASKAIGPMKRQKQFDLQNEAYYGYENIEF